MERFGQKVGQHLFRWAMVDGDPFGFKSIHNPEVTNVDVPQLMPSGGTAVCGKLNGTLIILGDGAHLDRNALGVHKIHRPYSVG